MKAFSLRCPECSASLDVEEGREQLFCQYCGTRIVVQNENERVYRHIDEADVRRSETERLVRLKELEMEAARREDEKAARSRKVKASLALVAIGIVMTVSGSLLGKATGDPNSGFYTMSIVGFLLLMGACGTWFHDTTKDTTSDKGSKRN